MRLARWVFLIAGIMGLIATVPLVFAGHVMGGARPEFYYGFVCLNICWQVVYLFIASDPLRHRPIMIPAFLAKGSSPVVLTWLYLLGAVSPPWLVIGAVDGVWTVLFLFASWRVRGRPVVPVA